MRDQCFGVAKIVRNRRNVQIIGKTESISLVCPHIKSNEIAAARHLPTGEIILRMGFVAGINHTSHLVMSVQKVHQLFGIVAMGIDAHGQCLKAFQHDPSIEGG